MDSESVNVFLTGYSDTNQRIMHQKMIRRFPDEYAAYRKRLGKEDQRA